MGFGLLLTFVARAIITGTSAMQLSKNIFSPFTAETGDIEKFFPLTVTCQLSYDVVYLEYPEALVDLPHVGSHVELALRILILQILLHPLLETVQLCPTQILGGLVPGYQGQLVLELLDLQFQLGDHLQQLKAISKFHPDDDKLNRLFFLQSSPRVVSQVKKLTSSHHWVTCNTGECPILIFKYY